MDSWRKSVPGREKSKCKGPEVGTRWYVREAEWWPVRRNLQRNEVPGHAGPFFRCSWGPAAISLPFMVAVVCPCSGAPSLFTPQFRGSLSSLSQESVNFFYKWPDSKYFRLREPYDFWCHDSIQLVSTLWRSKFCLKRNIPLQGSLSDFQST